MNNYEKFTVLLQKYLRLLSVAQLVEQLTLNQRVTGSNPVRETNNESII